MSAPVQLLIKGLVVKNRLEFAKSVGGERMLQHLREVPGVVGEILATPMLSMKPFPLADYDAFCRAIAKQITGDEETTYHRMGAFQADLQRTLQNVSLGQKTDPAQLIAGLPRHLPIHLSGPCGTLTHELPSERLGRLIWGELAESRDSFCQATLGYAARLLENAGLLGVGARHRECIAHGGRRCLWEFTWEKATGARRTTMALKAIHSVA